MGMQLKIVDHESSSIKRLFEKSLIGTVLFILFNAFSPHYRKSNLNITRIDITNLKPLYTLMF